MKTVSYSKAGELCKRSWLQAMRVGVKMFVRGRYWESVSHFASVEVEAVGNGRWKRQLQRTREFRELFFRAD